MLSSSYLCCRHSPDLEVVWAHEHVSNTNTLVANNPLVEVFGLCVCDPSFQGSIDQTVHALDLLFFGKHRDVVLEGIGDPEAFASYVGDSLVGEPIVVFGEGLVNAVVEVFVVGEDDMAADVVELVLQCYPVFLLNWLVRELLTKPSGVTSVEARPPGVVLQSTIIHDGPSYLH